MVVMMVVALTVMVMMVVALTVMVMMMVMMVVALTVKPSFHLVVSCRWHDKR